MYASWMNGAWIVPGFPFSGISVEALQDWNISYYMLLFVGISIQHDIPPHWCLLKSI
jgi:hypothetical protein